MSGNHHPQGIVSIFSSFAAFAFGKMKEIEEQAVAQEEVAHYLIDDVSGQINRSYEAGLARYRLRADNRERFSLRDLISLSFPKRAL